jgi:hypothetical protein
MVRNKVPEQRPDQSHGGGDYPIVLPKLRRKKDFDQSALYIELNTPEHPTLRDDFDQYRATELRGLNASATLRWLISYMISQRLKPPGF